MAGDDRNVLTSVAALAGELERLVGAGDWASAQALESALAQSLRQLCDDALHAAPEQRGAAIAALHDVRSAYDRSVAVLICTRDRHGADLVGHRQNHRDMTAYLAVAGASS